MIFNPFTAEDAIWASRWDNSPQYCFIDSLQLSSCVSAASALIVKRTRHYGAGY